MENELDDLDEGWALIGRLRVTRTYLTRAATAALDAVEWAEGDLVARLRGGDVAPEQYRDDNAAALGWLREFDARAEENTAPPTVAAAWHLPGGAAAHVVLEIGSVDPVDDSRTGTAYVFLGGEIGY